MDLTQREQHHVLMLRYICSLFSVLIGSSSGVGVGQGCMGCSSVCPYYFLHRQFSAFQLPLKHQQFWPHHVQKGILWCRGTLRRKLLCNSNFREQLFLQMPIPLRQFHLFEGSVSFWQDSV